MSEAEIRACVIADNKLAENAGWDRNLLGLEFQYLSGLDIDFDVSLTSFELPEIDILIGELDAANSNEPADTPIPLPAGPAVTRLGDIWQIGHHRLICGDSTERGAYQKLLGEARAQLVFADPPYNVPIAGHVGGLGNVQHREFAMASGEMSQSEFTAFLTSVFTHLAKFSADGGAPTANSKISASGPRTMAAWDRFTARNMNSSLSSNQELNLTSITLNSANTAATAPMSGAMLA
ncbi:MAG: hypothetical protein ABI146_09565 [Nitrobacter sp.]